MGAGVTAVQTLFRLKTNELNSWNCVQSEWSCPHKTCPSDVPATLQHVFWEYPIATAAWSYFGNRWRRLGDNVMDNLMDLCASLSLLDTTARAWMAAGDHVEVAGNGL